MAHNRFHALTATDHTVSAGSAYAIAGVNSSGGTNQYIYLRASDNATIVTSGTGIFISATTNAPGTTTQVVKFPLALQTVEINSSNAFWNASSGGTFMDESYVTFIDSGRGIATWWGIVPFNVNATPAWGLEVLSKRRLNVANSNTLVLSVDALSIALGESNNGAGTSLVSAGSFTINSASLLTVSTMTATDFDGTLAVSAGDYLKIKLTRIGSADTLNSHWDVYGVLFKCTVDT